MMMLFGSKSFGKKLVNEVMNFRTTYWFSTGGSLNIAIIASVKKKFDDERTITEVTELGIEH
jgi:hypothetical protein